MTNESSESNAELPRGADSAVKRALEEVTAELAELEPQYELLSARLLRLRGAYVSLRSLLGLPDEKEAVVTDAPRDVVDARRVARERAREAAKAAQVARDAAAVAARVEAQRAMVAAAANDGDEPSSTERVVQLIREAGVEGLTRREIYVAFAERGWMDPDWQQPDAAIRMALRRATEKAPIVQIEPDRWAYRPRSRMRPGGGA